MKKTFMSIVYAILWSILVYLWIAFYNNEPNLFIWSKDCKFCFIWFGNVPSVVIYIAMVVKNNIDNE